METPKFRFVEVGTNNIDYATSNSLMYVKVGIDLIETETINFLYISGNKGKLKIKDAQNRYITMKDNDYFSECNIDNLNEMTETYKDIKEAIENE